jgi:hypothetical protein
MTKWPSEIIPDGDLLFMRIHQDWIPGGELNLGVFRDHGIGMSTDWAKYATALDTKNRARDPNKNEVLSFNARDLRSVPLEIQHTPDEQNNNRAHTDVIGEKTPKVRVLLSRMFSWVNLQEP